MADEPQAMREIHAIREKLYEEEKNLSPEERTARIHREAEEIARRYNLKIQPPAATISK